MTSNTSGKDEKPAGILLALDPSPKPQLRAIGGGQDDSSKYLMLADKATRTVALLSEALDRHRGKGQQTIIKHVGGIQSRGK